jgi:hypothetical protein
MRPQAEQRQTATNRICPERSRACRNWGFIGFPQQTPLTLESECTAGAEGVALAPRKLVSANFGFVPHMFTSPWHPSGRRICLSLQSWCLRRSAGSRPCQEKQCTPADFLSEFDPASLEGQPYPFARVFLRNLAEGALHLQGRGSRHPHTGKRRMRNTARPPASMEPESIRKRLPV